MDTKIWCTIHIFKRHFTIYAENCGIEALFSQDAEPPPKIDAGKKELQINFVWPKITDWFWLACILPSSPELSSLLATLTASPQISYSGLLAPITPAVTGPVFIPK